LRWCVGHLCLHAREHQRLAATCPSANGSGFVQTDEDAAWHLLFAMQVHEDWQYDAWRKTWAAMVVVHVMLSR
jgi:ketopantoate reductase